jgi:hypothetical protein
MRTHANLLGFMLCLPLPAQAPNAIPTQDVKVDVGGCRLQFHVVPGKSPAILFEAGAETTRPHGETLSRPSRGPANTFTESSRLYSPAMVRLIVLMSVDGRLPSFTNGSAQ